MDVPGLGRRRHERGRRAALLRERGYATLADDPGGPAAIKQAAADEALAVWTDEHLVTFDASAIDARPER